MCPLYTVYISQPDIVPLVTPCGAFNMLSGAVAGAIPAVSAYNYHNLFDQLCQVDPLCYCVGIYGFEPKLPA